LRASSLVGIKQIVTMLLATSPPELTLNHPEFGDFVLDRVSRGHFLRMRMRPIARVSPIAQSGVITTL
jgi:hypothetical protein